MPQLKVRVGCVVLAVVMSAVTYYFVEPKLRWGRFGGYKAAGLLSVMVVIGVAGYSVERHEGYTARVPVDVDENKIKERFNSVFPAANGRFVQYFQSLKGVPSFPGIMEKEDGQNTIAVLGDSHANALLPGLLINEDNSDGIVLFAAGCAIPLIGVQSCSSELKRFPLNVENYKVIGTGFEYVLSHSEIKKVILTNFPGCFQWWGIRSIDNSALSDQEQILSDAISRTFRALSDAGKEVVYALDVPTFSSDDGNDWAKSSQVPAIACAAKLDSVRVSPLPLRSALNLWKSDTSIDEVCSMREVDNSTAKGHALLKKLLKGEAAKYENIHVVDLSKLVCQNQICRMNKNGKMLYQDSNHLSQIGSAVVTPKIFQAFRE